MEKPRRGGYMELAVFGASFGAILLRLVYSLIHVRNGWDDGAITAAFARTFMRSGAIALTPVSGRVEGFSTVSWFLLLAPAGMLGSPYAVLAWAKILAAICACANVLLVAHIVKSQFQSRAAAAASGLMIATLVPTQAEITNGMEMNLAATLYLVLFLVLTEPRRYRVLLASVVAFLILLTRFEAPFALLFVLIGFTWAALRKDNRGPSLRGLFLLSAIVIAEFCAIEGVRHHLFGVWMPNTVYAKRFYPYRAPGTWWHNFPSHVFTLMELAVCGFSQFAALAILGCALWTKKIRPERLKMIHPGIWTLAVSCYLWDLAVGSNWGYQGRMIMGTLPFVILLVVGICVLCAPDQRSLMPLLALVVFFQAFPLLEHPFLDREFIYPNEATIESAGYGADLVRQSLGRDRISLMIPDVGGTALCCSRLNIIDSGLLADPELAQLGYADMPAYFEKTKPDLVETHGWFQNLGNMYPLLTNYSMVAANGKRFFLRNDHMHELQARHVGVMMPVDQAPGCQPPAPEDLAYSKARGVCLVLDKTPLQTNHK